MWVSLPTVVKPEEREELANRMAEKSLDVLIEEGLLILAGINEP